MQPEHGAIVVVVVVVVVGSGQFNGRTAKSPKSMATNCPNESDAQQLVSGDRVVVVDVLGVGVVVVGRAVVVVVVPQYVSVCSPIVIESQSHE